MINIILISIFTLYKNTCKTVQNVICTSSIIYNLYEVTFDYTSIWLFVQSILLIYFHTEELSNVSYLATCPIKKEEGLSGKEPLKLLA